MTKAVVLVVLTLTPAEPAWIVVALVELVEPIVTPWTAAPVPIAMVCAVAPLPMAKVPLPDSIVVELVELVEPMETP